MSGLMTELRPHSGNRATLPDDLKSLHLPSGNRPQPENVGRANYNKGSPFSIFHITFVICHWRRSFRGDDKCNMKNAILPVCPAPIFDFAFCFPLPSPIIRASIASSNQSQNSPGFQMGQSTQTTQKGLVRGIRRWDLVAVAINGTIGAGIFGLPSKAYALVGPYSVIAFIVCALVVGLIVLCSAEVGSRFSETGGPYLYAREAFGPIAGFEVGWLLWLARVTAFAANSNLLIDYLGYFHPGIGAGAPRVVALIAIAVAMTAVNIIGVRNAALFSDVFTIGKLIPLALFICAGLFFLDPGNFSPAPAPAFSSFSKSTLLLVYAFTGFEMAIIPAGEARDPQRNLPFAILTSLALVTVVYILIQVVCVGTLPELAASNRPLADSSERFLGVVGATVITVGVAISIIGNLVVVLLAAARLPFAMAGDHS